MINKNSPVVGVPPRITAARFAQVLRDKGSPVAGEAQAMYDAIVACEVDPAFALACFHHESEYGLKGVCANFNTKSPGNTRSSRIDIQTFVMVPGKGNYVKYPSWELGAKDLAWRLVDPAFEYAKKGATTIATILPIFAPVQDGNDPEVYIKKVVNLMNTWLPGGEEVNTPMKLKIALAAGHHNEDGGNAVEKSLTGPLCQAYAGAFRAAGCDVRVITPDDGLGEFDGGLDGVAGRVVEWSKAGWKADLFLEIHTEGVADTTVRGVFAIYPDWGNDFDRAVKSDLGIRIARAISAVSGIPVRENGLMSEKKTGVGLDGFRLGIFRVTAPVAASTTRLIVEHGSHSSPADLAILRKPGMVAAIAGAAVKTICNYFGEVMSTTNSAPEVIQVNGHVLGHGILNYWRQFQIPGVQHPLGLPLSDEIAWTDPAGNRLTIQVFERGVLGFDATIPDPAFRVQGLLIGSEWATSHAVHA